MKENILIVINGSPGLGKSTLSQRFVDEHPMTLNLDIDRIWHMMGQWQESRPKSHEQKMQLSYEIASAHLGSGNDVVIADHINDKRILEMFEAIAEKHRAKIVEIALICNEDEAVARCLERGKSMGHKTGFRPGGILESEGGEAKIREMFRQVLTTTEQRPNTIKLNVIKDDFDGTYTQFVEAIKTQTA